MAEERKISIAPKLSNEQLLDRLVMAREDLKGFSSLCSCRIDPLKVGELIRLEFECDYFLGATLVRMNPSLSPLFSEGDVVTLAKWEELTHYYRSHPDYWKILHSEFEEFIIVRYLFFTKERNHVHLLEVGTKKDDKISVLGIFPAVLFRRKG